MSPPDQNRGNWQVERLDRNLSRGYFCVNLAYDFPQDEKLQTRNNKFFVSRVLTLFFQAQNKSFSNFPIVNQFQMETSQWAILGLTSLQAQKTASRKRSCRSIEGAIPFLSELTFLRFIFSTPRGCESFPSIVNSEFFHFWIWIIKIISHLIVLSHFEATRQPRNSIEL